MYIIIITIVSIFLIFNIFILLLKLKIEKLEMVVINLFKKKNSLIPCIYEISKSHFVKHNQVFSEILKLKKITFGENNEDKKLFERLKTQMLIHNELNFIFKIFSKYPKVNKEEKFIYIHSLIMENNDVLSHKISLYKKIIKKYNNLISIKNITLIGLLIPLNKKIIL